MNTIELEKVVRRLKMILFGLLSCMMLVSIMGCSFSESGGRAEVQVTSEEDMDTGAWEKGTVYYNDYRIDIEGPKVGHPSGDSLWSTYYEDENEKDVNVDFYGIEGSLKERIEELTAEGKEVSKGWLWGNKCQFYIDNATICMIPLGEDAYLQVEFTHDDDSLAELTRVSDGFTLTIEKER